MGCDQTLPPPDASSTYPDAEVLSVTQITFDNGSSKYASAIISAPSLTCLSLDYSLHNQHLRIRSRALPPCPDTLVESLPNLRILVQAAQDSDSLSFRPKSLSLHPHKIYPELETRLALVMATDPRWDHKRGTLRQTEPFDTRATYGYVRQKMNEAQVFSELAQLLAPFGRLQVTGLEKLFVSRRDEIPGDLAQAGVPAEAKLPHAAQFYFTLETVDPTLK